MPASSLDCVQLFCPAVCIGLIHVGPLPRKKRRETAPLSQPHRLFRAACFSFRGVWLRSKVPHLQAPNTLNLIQATVNIPGQPAGNLISGVWQDPYTNPYLESPMSTLNLALVSIILAEHHVSPGIKTNLGLRTRLWDPCVYVVFWGLKAKTLSQVSLLQKYPGQFQNCFYTMKQYLN